MLERMMLHERGQPKSSPSQEYAKLALAAGDLGLERGDHLGESGAIAWVCLVCRGQQLDERARRAGRHLKPKAVVENVLEQVEQALLFAVRLAPIDGDLPEQASKGPPATTESSVGATVATARGRCACEVSSKK